MLNEKRRLIERLTIAGFWEADDEGDVTTDEKALGSLLDRVERRLAKNVLFFVNGPGTGRSSYEIGLVWPGGKRFIGSGSTLAYAICDAALALPGFLHEHPECARAETYVHCLAGNGLPGNFGWRETGPPRTGSHLV